MIDITKEKDDLVIWSQTIAYLYDLHNFGSNIEVSWGFSTNKRLVHSFTLDSTVVSNKIQYM